MTAYVFPGQGSQIKGMGKELFDEFSQYTKEADEILGYSIKELCLTDEDNRLDITRYTQPALYIVNALSYFKKIQETAEKADYVLGHSLGEYNALLAAGVFDFKTGLCLVKKRGELMHQARNGGMAAVIGLSRADIQLILKENGLAEIDIANYNTPNQYSISGPSESIAAAKEIFEKNGALKYVILSVSGAFHSRYMGPAAKEYADFVNSFHYKEPQITVISNYTARPYLYDEIGSNLSNQIDHPVRWVESVEYLKKKGITDMKQVGPGKAVLGMVKAILRERQLLQEERI